MKSKTIIILLVFIGLIALTTSLSSAPVSAQSGSGYELTWNTIDGGGTIISSGGTVFTRWNDRASGCWHAGRWSVHADRRFLG